MKEYHVERKRNLAQTTKILPAKILPQNFEPCATAIVDLLVASLLRPLRNGMALSTFRAP